MIYKITNECTHGHVTTTLLLTYKFKNTWASQFYWSAYNRNSFDNAITLIQYGLIIFSIVDILNWLSFNSANIYNLK